MAEACGFEEANDNLGPPEGMSYDECTALQICRAEVKDYPIIISCWKLTQEELDEIVKTKRVWLMVLGQTMNPVVVSGTKFNMIRG